MKKVILYFILLLFIFATSVLSASPLIRVYDEEPKENLVCHETTELKSELSELIHFPNAKWNMELEGDVKVSVTIDRFNTLHIVQVTGENQYLVAHVEKSLDDKIVKSHPEWIGKVFSTTIEFRRYS